MARPEAASLFDIPRQAWRHPLGAGFDDVGHATADPMIDDGPWAGVPVGGLGAGSIGRTQRGDFARWHLRVGTHRFEPVPACAFSLFVEDPETGTQAHVLSTLRPEEGPTAWAWDLPEGAGTYHALFPRAWTVLDWDALPVGLAGSQLSPVIAGNVRESSYPVGLFQWRVRNPTARRIRVGLMFTWPALDEDGRPARDAVVEPWADDSTRGAVLRNPPVGDDPPTQFAIAAADDGAGDVSVGTFDLSDRGSALWADFAADGALGPGAANAGIAGAQPCAAVAVTLDLEPGATGSARFALAWDFPVMRFGAGTAWYRRYTRFYGHEGGTARQIAQEALARHREWESAIEAWQAPVLSDPRKPDWYTGALFNELYVLVDGGTAWEDGRVGEPSPAAGEGQFAFLECFDYPFYNTYDVLFYGSWALALLWPELEKRVIRTVAGYVPLADDRTVTVETTGAPAPRKVAGAVPHDAGGPEDDPWLAPNTYTYQDSTRWKDLNSKFVLQLWRDRVLLGAPELVREAWPAVVQALEYLERFDVDGDGLPDHEGVPDQTFDNWPMKGASAYGGGLWLAALTAAVEMAREVGDGEAGHRYAELLARGRESYVRRLWNGRWFRFDAEGPSPESVMADQLCGQWYADACVLPPFIDGDMVRSALTAVVERNVRGFAGGRMGAVNGTLPDGSVEGNSHAREVWPGVTYALAAALHERGMTDEAWEVARGAVAVTYERGLWFRTPEAWDIDGNFRASMYMRPLAIWAIEHALREGGAGRRG